MHSTRMLSEGVPRAKTPLTADRLKQWDHDQLVRIILDGVPGTPMPGWRPLMTEAEADWIANVLKLGTLR